MFKNFLPYLIALIALWLSACSTTKDASEAYQNETPNQIYSEGVKALRKGDYSEATKRFEALEVQYPLGNNTETSQLYIIYAYYNKEEYVMASAAADRFIRTYSANPYVDYAYYMRGLADFYQNMGFLERAFSIDLAERDLTPIKKTYTDFSELTERFPESPYTPAAHQYLVYLRNILAKHELNIANYYYIRKAYVASANRASEVVKHYQGAEYIPDALVLMVKSYRQLHLELPEQQAMAVLEYNFPQYTKSNSILDISS